MVENIVGIRLGDEFEQETKEERGARPCLGQCRKFLTTASTPMRAGFPRLLPSKHQEAASIRRSWYRALLPHHGGRRIEPISGRPRRGSPLRAAEPLAPKIHRLLLRPPTRVSGTGTVIPSLHHPFSWLLTKCRRHNRLQNTMHAARSRLVGKCRCAKGCQTADTVVDVALFG